MDAKKALKRLTVLYAEDNPDTRKNITETLQLFVHEVIAVSNGAEAIDAFANHTVHMVILDYVMPLINGIDAAAAIRETDPTVPIIMLSSHSEKEKLLSAIKIGVADYLEKPITLKKLQEALMSAVDKLMKAGRLNVCLGEDVEYNYIEKAIRFHDNLERLSKNEYLFLELLLVRPESLVTTDMIETVLGRESIEPNAMRNLVYRLRKKIPLDVIVTVKDVGYLIKPSS